MLKRRDECEYSDILDKIKRDEIWVDVETVATLKNVTNRSVKISIHKYI